MKWKNKLYIAMGLDAIDLLLGVIGTGLNVVLPGLAILINNLRGVIWDLLTVPILFYLFGSKGLIYLGEVVFPDEIDMFIPTATLIAFSSKKNKKKK